MGKARELIGLVWRLRALSKVLRNIIMATPTTILMVIIIITKDRIKIKYIK